MTFKDFVDSVRETIRKEFGRLDVNDQIFSNYYWIANKIHKFPIHFIDFKNHILLQQTTYYYCRGRYVWNKPSKYQKKIHHKKKEELSDHKQAKKDWREKTKIKKDKSRTHRSWSNRGAGKWYKKYSNRMHRNWTKQKLYNQDWDLNEREYKFFLDPWMWD